MKLRACAVGCVGLAVVALGAGRGGVEPRVPAVQWVGPTSSIHAPGYHLVTDEAAWRDLWEQHRGELAERAHQGWVMPPEIDFERYMVVACFRGESTNRNGERAEGVFRRGEALVVRYDSVTFQTASFGEQDVPEVSTPYGIWVIEQHDGPVVIEEDKNGLIGADPAWREVHRFAIGRR